MFYNNTIHYIFITQHTFAPVKCYCESTTPTFIAEEEDAMKISVASIYSLMFKNIVNNMRLFILFDNDTYNKPNVLLIK